MQPELISALCMIISKLTAGLLGLNSAFSITCEIKYTKIKTKNRHFQHYLIYRFVPFKYWIILGEYLKFFLITCFGQVFYACYVGLLGLLTWVEHSLRSTRKIQSEGRRKRCEKKQKLWVYNLTSIRWGQMDIFKGSVSLNFWPLSRQNTLPGRLINFLKVFRKISFLRWQSIAKFEIRLRLVIYWADTEF